MMGNQVRSFMLCLLLAPLLANAAPARHSTAASINEEGDHSLANPQIDRRLLVPPSVTEQALLAQNLEKMAGDMRAAMMQATALSPDETSAPTAAASTPATDTQPKAETLDTRDVREDNPELWHMTQLWRTAFRIVTGT